MAAGGRVLDLWDLQDMVSILPYRRFWAAGPGPGGLHLVVEEEKAGRGIGPELKDRLEHAYGMKINIEVVPGGTLCDRSDLLSLGVVGKPRYIYSAGEMEQKKYLKSARL